MGKIEQTGSSAAGRAHAPLAGRQAPAEALPKLDVSTLPQRKGTWGQGPTAKVTLSPPEGNPLVFLLGGKGSGKVFDGTGKALSQSQVDGLVRQLAAAYTSAPARTGRSDAADAYQDALKLLAEALGKTEGHLLAPSHRPARKVTITWPDGAESTFGLGKRGSGKVFDAAGNALTRTQVSKLARQLAAAYREAPERTGRSDAADPFQDALRRLAETLGVTEGDLLLK